MNRWFVLLSGIALVSSGCSSTQADDASTTEITEPGVLSFSEEMIVGDPQGNAADPFFQLALDGKVFLGWTEQNTQLAPDGEEFLGWTEQDTGTEGRNAFVALLNRDSKQLAEPRRLNNDPGEVHAYGGDNRPKLTIGSDGSMAAIWATPLAEFKTGYIQVAHAESNGLFSSSSTLNDDGRAVAHAFSNISTSPDGKIFATWIDGRNRTERPPRGDIAAMMNISSQLFMAVSEDDGKTYGKNYLIAKTVCACCVPNIVFLDGGQTVVVSHRFLDENGVRDHVVIRSTDRGETFSEPVMISDDGWVTGCPHAGISIATDSEERIHGLWFTAGRVEAEAGIYYTFSEDGGISFEPRQLVAKTPAKTVLHTQVKIGPNDAVWATWVNIEDERPQIFLAHRDRDANQWDRTYQVSDATSNAILPSLAVDAENVYIAWTERKGEGSQVKLRWASLLE